MIPDGTHGTHRRSRTFFEGSVWPALPSTWGTCVPLAHGCPGRHSGCQLCARVQACRTVEKVPRGDGPGAISSHFLVVDP
jgi:hypothetical protein